MTQNTQGSHERARALWQRLDAKRNEYPALLRGGRFKRFIDSIKQSRECESSSGGPNVETPEPKLCGLFKAARTGCCKSLKAVIPQEDKFKHFVNRSDEDGVTALHIAAEYNQCDDVKFLLEAGAEVRADFQGLTPLHIAASTSQPNPEIAKVLIQHMKPDEKDSRINEMANDDSTIGNTALHFAAVNEHISHEFIQTLEKIDPSIRNDKGDTAFHVAARMENPDVIVSMLDVFTPAKSGWDMDKIDAKGEVGLTLLGLVAPSTSLKPTQSTLLEICAKRGNAAAVAKLIKYGAQISKQVFFDLVDESTNNPTETDKLIAVYRTITRNCVLWDCLKKRSESNTNQLHPRLGTEPTRYRERQREIMLDLLTKPDEDKKINAVEYAIKKGEKKFLHEIVNTPDVFRLENDSGDQSKERLRRILGCGAPPTEKLKGVNVTYDITGFLTPRHRGSLLQSICCKRSNAVEPEDEHSPSYLRLITENKDLWKNTNILLLEPFLTITRPICGFVQLFYLLVALIQLVHMIGFSILYMSPFCNASDQCSASVDVSEFSVGMNFLWLLWPSVIFVVSLYVQLRYRCKNMKDVVYGCLTARLVSAPILWAWYFRTFIFHDFDVSLTSMVFLFGWLVTASFFIDAVENASIFSFLLRDIIIKDILSSFGIMFVFVLVGFSSAIHLLREYALLGQRDYSDTLYNVFAAGLTTGEFMKETLKNPADSTVADSRPTDRIHLLQTVFAMYLCCTSIIMFNILITMMNNRYKEARKKAKNVWRFGSLRAFMLLSSFFGFNLQKVLRCFRCYWKLRKFTGRMKNPYYEVFTVDDKGKVSVFLRLRNTVPNENTDNQGCCCLCNVSHSVTEREELATINE